MPRGVGRCRWRRGRRTDPHVTCTACGTVHPTECARRADHRRAHRPPHRPHPGADRYGGAGRRPHRPDLRRRAVQHVRTVIPDVPPEPARPRPRRSSIRPRSADHVAPWPTRWPSRARSGWWPTWCRSRLAAHTITPHQRWLLDSGRHRPRADGRCTSPASSPRSPRRWSPPPTTRSTVPERAHRRPRPRTGGRVVHCSP